MPDAEAHAMALVRDADPDRYLSILYAPADRRGALAALYAFNVEVARIRDAVREPLPGEIRLQWWRDALAAGVATGNPVADGLLEVIRHHDLPLAAFDNYLEARIFDLYDDPMPDRASLEGYCGETASAIIQLAAIILDRRAAPAFADIAGHAGCAQAIAGLLRLLPVHRARGQCYVPREILSAAGLDRDSFVSPDGDAGARRAVAAMLAVAREHMEIFEAGASHLPTALRAAFLPPSLASAYLDRIARAPLSGGGDPGALRRHWIMLRHAVRGWPSRNRP